VHSHGDGGEHILVGGDTVFVPATHEQLNVVYQIRREQRRSQERYCQPDAGKPGSVCGVEGEGKGGARGDRPGMPLQGQSLQGEPLAQGMLEGKQQFPRLLYPRTISL
jgi:hypothetical protein